MVLCDDKVPGGGVPGPVTPVSITTLVFVRAVQELLFGEGDQVPCGGFVGVLYRPDSAVAPAATAATLVLYCCYVPGILAV